MILADWAGPLLCLAGFTVMFIMVPSRRILNLAWIGVFGGFYLALLLVLLMQNIRGFWHFQKVDFFYLYHIPFFLSLTWMPLIILFGHLICESKTAFQKYAVILAFPLGAVLIHYLLIQNGMLRYNHWNLFETFWVSLAIHAGISGYLGIKKKAGQIL